MSEEISVNNTKAKNWPSCRPIIRHNIEEDIPPRFQSVARAMFYSRFYTVFFLFVNFVTNIYYYQVDHGTIYDLSFSVVWLVLWTVLTFAFHRSFYRAFAYNNSSSYTTFFCGSIFEFVLSLIAICGFKYTGFLGYFGLAFDESNAPYNVISFLLIIAFTLKAAFVIFSLVLLSKRRITPEDGLKDDTPLIVKEVNVLPADLDGRKINYLPVRAGNVCDVRVEKLSTLPENSFIVISEWKRAQPESNGSYILHVAGEPARAYWSDPHVTRIIDSGNVDPMTQMLTISRLPDGSFVFGVVSKE